MYYQEGYIQSNVVELKQGKGVEITQMVLTAIITFILLLWAALWIWRRNYPARRRDEDHNHNDHHHGCGYPPPPPYPPVPAPQNCNGLLAGYAQDLGYTQGYWDVYSRWWAAAGLAFPPNPVLPINLGLGVGAGIGGLGGGAPVVPNNPALAIAQQNHNAIQNNGQVLAYNQAQIAQMAQSMSNVNAQLGQILATLPAGNSGAA